MNVWLHFNLKHITVMYLMVTLFFSHTGLWMSICSRWKCLDNHQKSYHAHSHMYGLQRSNSAEFAEGCEVNKE